MSKKETAVEWLDSNLIHTPYTQEDFRYNYETFERAKQMEIEQITNAYNSGYVQGFDLMADDYYQNIYGTDQGIEKSTD